MIEFVCPSCQSGLRVGDDAACQIVRCGSCQATVRVPDVRPEPPPPRNPEAARPAAESVSRSRPMRRRPPPPPPKSSRKMVFWILILLVIFGGIALAVCGGIISLTQPKWRTHESKQGGFTVEMPGDVNTDMREWTKKNPKMDFEVEGTILPFQNEGYGVMYRDLTPRDRGFITDDEKFLANIVSAIERDEPRVTIKQKRSLTVSGFPAREVVVTDPEEGTSIRRIVLADTRLYVLIAGGRDFVPETNPRVQRFLKSFAVTDPALLAKVGKRAKPVPPEPEPNDEIDLVETIEGVARGVVQGAKE